MAKEPGKMFTFLKKGTKTFFFLVKPSAEMAPDSFSSDLSSPRFSLDGYDSLDNPLFFLQGPPTHGWVK
jgi:hypothetical protein